MMRAPEARGRDRVLLLAAAFAGVLAGCNDCPPGDHGGSLFCHATDRPADGGLDGGGGDAGCGVHASCPAGSVCDPTTGACVECVTDADCEETAATPWCDPATDTCGRCTSDDDCDEPRPLCDTTTGACFDGCRTDAECADTPA